jgi:phosphate transport system permease protein
MSNPELTATTVLPDFHSATAVRYRRWRHIQDFLTRYIMAIGGIGVIVAILLIAFYLFYVVAPMFIPAHMKRITSYIVPGGDQVETEFLAMEEQAEIGLRLTADGRAIFFNTKDGVQNKAIDFLEGLKTEVTAFSHGDPAHAIFAYGLSNGSVMVGRHVYRVTYPQGNQRLITPEISYPAGREPIVLDRHEHALTHIAVESDGDNTTIIGVTDDNHVLLMNVALEKAFLSDDFEIKRTTGKIEYDGGMITHLVMDKEQREATTYRTRKTLCLCTRRT